MKSWHNVYLENVKLHMWSCWRASLYNKYYLFIYYSTNHCCFWRSCCNSFVDSNCYLNNRAFIFFWFHLHLFLIWIICLWYFWCCALIAEQTVTQWYPGLGLPRRGATTSLVSSVISPSARNQLLPSNWLISLFELIYVDGIHRMYNLIII